MKEKLEALYSVKDIAERYRCERRVVYAWIESGLLPASKPVKQWLVKESDLIEFDSLVSTGACVKNYAACVTLKNKLKAGGRAWQA